MLYSYILLLIITLIIYNLIWISNCRLGCVTSRGSNDGHDRMAARCTCEACLCGQIQRFNFPGMRVRVNAVDTICQPFSYCTDRFNDWHGENCTRGRRHAQLAVDGRTSMFGESVEEFILVPDPSEGQQIMKKKATICPSTSVSASTSVTQAVSLLDPNVDGQQIPKGRPTTGPGTSVSASASLTQAVTQYGYDLVERITATASEFHNIEPRVMIAPNRLWSRLSTRSSTSAAPKEPQAEEAIDGRRNCSKCVEQGKTCIGECPIAAKKRNKDNKH